MVREFFPYHFENKKLKDYVRAYALTIIDILITDSVKLFVNILAKILAEPNLSILITSEASVIN